MRHYIALIHKDDGADYGVSFPDLPGCITARTNLDEARVFAEEALEQHLMSLRRMARPYQSPPRWKRSADRSNQDSVAVIVAAKSEAVKAIRLNITPPEEKLMPSARHEPMAFLAHAGKRQA